MTLRASSVALASLLAALPAHADPPTKVACAEAHGESQSLRNAGKMTAARAELVRCADAACPLVLKKECAGWLEEVDRTMPSIVLGAKDAHGDDVIDVRVSVDGRPLVTRLDGMPVSLDPGVHTLRFESPPAAPVEQRLMVRLGEQNRRVDVVFTAPAKAAPTPPKEDPVDTSPARPIPALAFVFAGVGVVSLGAFAFFGLDGKSKQRALDDAGCKPGCAQSDVDAIKRDYRFADVSLAVSVLALGAATYVFVTRPEAGGGVAVGASLVGPRDGGLTVRGAF